MNVLPLPLLVLLIRADHAHDTAPAHDLALVANTFHGRSHLHDNFLTIRPRPVSRGDNSISTRSATTSLTKFLFGPGTGCATIS